MFILNPLHVGYFPVHFSSFCLKPLFKLTMVQYLSLIFSVTEYSVGGNAVLCEMSERVSALLTCCFSGVWVTNVVVISDRAL